jgi:hypothetical protein
MANPNIVNVTTIYGNTSSVSLTTTSATSLVSNAASSGKVFKINSIVAANVDGTTAADISINVYSAAALGGTAFPIDPDHYGQNDLFLPLRESVNWSYRRDSK